MDHFQTLLMGSGNVTMPEKLKEKFATLVVMISMTLRDQTLLYVLHLDGTPTQQQCHVSRASHHRLQNMDIGTARILKISQNTTIQPEYVQSNVT